MTERREPALHLRLQELLSNLRQGVLYLRKLMLPSDGLMIGENRIDVEADAAGVQNLLFRRQDGTEVNMTGTPCARVYNSAAISINNNTVTSLTFDSERFDTDTIHSTSSNTSRLTATTAGKYDIAGTASFVSNATGRRALLIRYNGTTVIAQQEWDTSQNGITYMTISTLYDMAVDDYVEMLVFQDSGGSLNINALSNHSPEFMMARVGPSGSTSAGVGDDHGTLTGLGDDDHDLYILKAGSRAFTGSQSMGSNKLTSLTAGSASGEAVEYDQLHTQNTDTGTTQTTFGIDTDASTPKLRLSGQSGGTGDYTTYLYPAVLLTDNRLIILPNAAGVVALTSDLHNQAHGPSQHTEGTAWRVVYQDASGDEQEIALGSSAQVLTSNGASSAPSFQAAGGGAVEHEAHITLVHSVSGTAF